MKKNRILVMLDGKRVRVMGENSKWWITDGGIFRKGNTQIAAFEEETAIEDAVIEEAVIEAMPEPTLVEEIADIKNEVEEPKKKTTTRKKKAEVKTEE